MKKIKLIIIIFFVCAYTQAQEHSVGVKDYNILNKLLVKKDSKTYIYKYFTPIKFLKPIIINNNFIHNLYGSCNSLDHIDFKLSKFIKSNKESLLENIDMSSYTKIKREGLHNNLNLSTNHRKKGLVYISKPIYLEEFIFIYYKSNDESKLLLLDRKTLKIVCTKYLYLNIDN